MKEWSKVVILILINIILAAGMLYFLDYMRILNFSDILQKVTGTTNLVPIRVEDPFLLEREELAKKWELLSTETRNLSNALTGISESNAALLTEESRLQEERQAFLNEQSLSEQQKVDENAYNVKINDVAVQIAGMPPQTAAEILNLQEDFQVVEIFRQMEINSADLGQQSVVPFLLTLMERDKAARIQTLMLANSY